MTLEPVVYYRLKAAILEGQLKMGEFTQLVRQREIQALTEAGLNPLVSYTLDDTTLSAISGETGIRRDIDNPTKV